MSNPDPDESQHIHERERWAEDHFAPIHSRSLPWEKPRWKGGAEESLSVSSVFYALTAIRKGTSRELKRGSLLIPRGQIFDAENWEEVDRPPEDAVRVITRALQAGAKGEKLIKDALELKPRARGAILARYIARKLSKPKGGWPKTEEDQERFDWDSAEWVKPSKGEVERELERRYPEVYKHLPKKDGNGGKLLRSEFWAQAGLKDEIDQGRGNG